MTQDAGHHLIRWFALALGIAVTAPSAVRAQQAQGPAGRPWVVSVSHYGKWLTLASAAGMIAVSATSRGDADDAFQQLEAFCAGDASRCAVVASPSGGAEVYADQQAEAMFQEYARLDRKAQGFLVGGQVSLVAAAGMFLIDLLYREEDDPENIPFTPFRVYSAPQQLGLALPF